MKFTLSFLLAGFALSAAPSSNPPTFHKDVAPILQKHCQSCHRPGEAAPMSFLDYKSTRPWAKAIKQATATKKMPPWNADPHVGQFSNARILAPAEQEILSRWADTGALEGNPKDAPAPLQFTTGWQIGQPDMVFEMPNEIDVPDKGVIEYTYVLIPTNFKEDVWIEAAEARPGNRAVMHHVIAFIREPGNKWLSSLKPGVPWVSGEKRSSGGGGNDGMANEWLAGYAPGTPPLVFKPGQARRIKAGSDIILQLHYTPNGKAAKDRTKVGVRFAKGPVKERVTIASAANGRFVIPPMAPAYPVAASITLFAPAKLVNLQPHMHLRGKSFAMRAIYPNGKSEELLWVPNYDFNWQHLYEPASEKLLPAGTRLEATAVFDNSPNNKFNPDPKAEVRWGDQSFEEMMIGFFDIAVDPKLEPRDIFQPRRPAPVAPRPSGE